MFIKKILFQLFLLKKNLTGFKNLVGFVIYPNL